jgi:prepilin-type N-terminal cleavage/methylation domain-containing protein
MRERGMTLVELLIAVAIVAAIAGAIAFLSRGARPYAMRSAVVQFDAAYAYAVSLAAASGNGATIVLLPRNGVPGFSIAIYSGRPTSANALVPAPMPTMLADGDVREANLGAPPLALFVNSGGHVSIEAGFHGATPAPLSNEPGCPQGGAWSLKFSDPRTSQGAGARSMPCAAAEPGTPVAIATVAPDSALPPPSPGPSLPPAQTPPPTPAPTPAPTPTPTTPPPTPAPPPPTPKPPTAAPVSTPPPTPVPTLPPAPCTADAQGYCLALVANSTSQVTCFNTSTAGRRVRAPYSDGSIQYELYRWNVPDGAYTKYMNPVDPGDGSCPYDQPYWSPADPRAATGDPALP